MGADRLDGLQRQAGRGRHLLVDSRDLHRNERPTDLTTLQHRTQQSAVLDPGLADPLVDQTHGVRREVADGAGAHLVGLRPPDVDRPIPAGTWAQVLDAQRHQFRPASEGIVSNREDHAVPQVAQRLAAGVQHSVHQPAGQALGLALRAAIGLAHALERQLDHAPFARVRHVCRPVQVRDAGHVAPDGCRLLGERLVVDEDRHRRRIGRQRHQRPRRAPLGEDAAVAEECPLGRCRERALRCIAVGREVLLDQRRQVSGDDLAANGDCLSADDGLAGRLGCHGLLMRSSGTNFHA